MESDMTLGGQPQPEERQQVSTAPAAPAEAAPADPNYRWKVLFSVVFGTFMVILDATAVNVALPTLQHVFKVPVDQVDGVLTAYVLALGIITPLAGYLAERFGIKRMYLISLFLFVLGSVLCAFAPSLPWLVVFRALQGLGGGMLGPLGISLLFGAFPEKQRGLAFGLYGIPLVVAPASGPVLGGYFVEYLDWRYIFFINIPVGLAGLLLGFFWLRESRRGTAARLDLPGILLSVISFGTLLYAIQRGSSEGWTSARILTLLSIGLLTFAVFVVVELFRRDPLLDLRLFTRRTFTVASVIGWVSTIALFGAEFLLPIYLQSLRERTPLQAGLLVLPLAISSGIVTPLAGALYNRIGPRWLIFVGSLLLAVNTWGFAHLTLDASYTEIMALAAIRGVALGLTLQTTLTVALTGLKPAQLPRASSLLNATRNVFQSFGIAMLGTIVTHQLTAYQDAARNDLHNAATALGQRFLQLVQVLQMRGLPAAAAQKAAAGQLLGSLVPQQFMQSINDAYIVTFWLALAVAVLALTLPGRARLAAARATAEEGAGPASAPAAAPASGAQGS
ncbi:MAG: DHA2 family efflux MFS transporter permease subunit [Thermogemmatispora sp.]|uniref:DHA2 family efflux MFS transporter permease subunit n=1 Tax=Thermogemmatispora sp. TaxID=1968838 RepID=UPI0019F992CF|nr:DHA2 family efflux MFS transporter permease subunit [Thermogemmatispora sp.]MBE3567155.1 DHA2 family efflux MFS transporter permease subunit [Thermogemmatispora sp.]